MRTVVSTFLAAAVLTGCAGYQLGSTNGVVAGTKSIQVTPFASKAIEPRLSDAVTVSLRKSIQQDGTYKLNTAQAGDIVLTGTIEAYDRQQLSYQPRDILTPRDYRILITAHVIARERGTGKTLLDREVTGRTTIRVGNDLSSAERQALPLAAEDLARSITSLLADGTW
ncbi:MAG TPA: LPS assembly lipoprotein LptE [Candidatus Saccharimonadales bacterium]|nr:LPS assembly lipoprotein LptE [Candidatus Saccharimonadales bacterium]